VEQIVLDGDGEEVRKLLSELLGHKDVRITMAIF
jgi:metal-responsive CopG/Arc/MetJ family transcriptional regulator